MRRLYDDRRGSSSARGYGADWQRFRLAVLAAEPLCRFCAAAGRIVAANEVDHIKTIADRPDLRLVRSNVRSLCKRCHSGRTAAGNVDRAKGCDAGGWPLARP